MNDRERRFPTDEDLAKEVSQIMYSPSDPDGKIAPLQFMLESLVLPEGVESYTDKEICQYLLNALGNK